MGSATWKLIIEDDAGKQIVVPFTREVITIGRKEGNTIRLTERNVSRNHAKLSKENGHVVVEDLKSFNGIKLNGDRIDGRVHVHEGDTIQIGDYHLAFHAQDMGASAGNGGNLNATQPLRRDTAPMQAGAEDDEFAGDTQRWEPPAGGLQLSVPGLATQEDRAFTEEHTIPQPPTQRMEGPPPPPPLPPQHTQAALNQGTFSPDKNGFGADSGDTERVSMDMLDQLGSRPPTVPNAPYPSPAGAMPTRKVEPELEPTVRQVASPPPITMPPAPAIPPHGAAQGAMPSPLSPAAAQGGSAPFPPSPLPHAPAPAPSPPAQAPHQPPPAPPPSAPQQQARPSSPASPGQAVPTGAPRTTKEEAKSVLEEQTEAMRASPGAEDVMYPRLVVLNTIFAGSTFSLRAAEAVMGRTEDNDITIEHKSVSRNHAKIVREGDRVRILDLKSANGVLVNNEEVEAMVLKPGDVVELGRVKLRYVPIGERFTVSPDEIERARIADAAGDDFESDAGTGVTNPVRKKQSGPQPSAPYDLPSTGAGGGKNPVFLVVGAVLIVLLVIAAFVVWKMVGGGGEKHVDNATAGNNNAAVGRVDNPDTPVKLEPVPTADDASKPPPVADDAAATPPPLPDDAAAKAAEAAKAADAAAAAKAAADAAKVADAGKPENAEKPPPSVRSRPSPPKPDPQAALKSAKQKILAGKPDEAVGELAPFVKSDNAEVHRTLGVAYAKLKQNELARKHYKRYLELNPKANDAAQVREILEGGAK